MGFGIRNCVICGRPYEAVRRRQVTCGNKMCKNKQHQLYTKQWIKDWLDRDPEGYMKYKRDKAAQYRERDKEIARQAATKTVGAEAVAGCTSTYAEQQIKKTLDLVPKINTEL